MQRDVFICHASEDKVSIARPLAAAYEAAGLSCWLDEAEIHWGDSLTGAVNQGMGSARFVIVVLSKSFLKKPWPERELNAALNIETSSGVVKVLPMLVGDKTAREALLKSYPLLNDKRYLIWEGDPAEAVDALRKRIGWPMSDSREMDSGSTTIATYRPTIKKRFTDRDRRTFVKAAFATIREYFKVATNDLAQQNDDIEAEIEDISASKLICHIFVKGDLRLRCKIWCGSSLQEHSICYVTGSRIDVSSDNTFNEILSLSDDDQELFFQGSISIHFVPLAKKATAHDVAEYLWRQFIRPLEN